MVLVSVLLGALLWGIPGAFSGVPGLILALTLCDEFEGSRWVAVLLSGRTPQA
jgi:AI-2 transport protein TqsA